MKTWINLPEMERLLSYPPEPGCILCLPGLPGGGDKACDRSPYGRPGTITGAAWRRSPGGLWVLDFDGSDDFVNLGNNPIPNGDFSLEVWARMDNNGVVLSTYNGSLPYWHLRAYGDVIRFYGQDSAAVSEAYWRHSTAIVGDSRYHHLVLVVDIDAGVYLYTDSVEATTLVSGSLADIDGTLHTAKELDIGRHPDGFGYLGGAIGVVRIYVRALGALEIRDHFDREKNLFGAWQR